MSKLKELIEKFCPNGVEYQKLDDILDYEQPTQYIVKSTEYDDSYNTPVLTAGQTFILGYTNEEDGIYKADKDSPTIIFDDFTTSFHWVDFDFKVKSSAMKMLRPKSTFEGSFKYVFYAMECIHFEAVNHTRHWISKYSQFEIPLPHPEVQEEIVKILDRFAEYAAELQAELQARQQQYEYYRNKLLTFSDIAVLRGGTQSVVWKTMSEIGYFYGGLTGKAKSDFENGNAKLITYMNVFNNIALKTDINDRVKISEGENQNTIAYGDALFTGSSETPNECGMSSVLNKETEEPLYLNSFCFGFRLYDKSIYNPDFLKHLLRSHFVREQIKRTANGVTRFNVSKKLFGKIKLPIPPIEEQDKVASILDKFETLVNDLSKGLPAEIAAVQERYEYYRNKLLTFKQVA